MITLRPTDLIFPVGDLQPALFPGVNLETLVSTWLLDAGRRTEQDDPARHWVYHKAYESVANRLAATPSTETYFNETSRSIGADRVKYFQDKAAQHLSEYNRLVGTESFLDAKPARMGVY